VNILGFKKMKNEKQPVFQA